MQTPLYTVHQSLGARMAPFAGWDMPIQYTGILKEHQHTRQKASIFDICHMGEFELSGPTAESDLELLLTQRVATLEIGQCRYGFMLNETGGVIDDLTVYRLAEDRFYLVVNAGTAAEDADWIRGHCSPTTLFEDLSAATAKLDVQGPESRTAMEAALEKPLPELGYFRCTRWEIDGIPCILSRTGYTGEWGYELYFNAAEAEKIWNRLTAPGLIQPAGLGARDTLRLEVGYPLYGHELNASDTPVGVTGGRFMSLKKDFIGRPAVERDLELGAATRLVGLLLDTRQAAREKTPVFQGDHEVGVVTSGSLAPSLGTSIAMALVRPEASEPGVELELQVRNRRLPARVVELPFYKDGTAR